MPQSDREDIFSTSDSETSWVDLDECQDSTSYRKKQILKSESGSKNSQYPSPALVLVETAFLASAASLIWLIDYYFPLGPLLKMFFPVPIALVFLRRGKRAAWMSAVVSSLLLSILMGPTRSVIFLLPYGLMGIQLGACWSRRSSWYVSIALGSLIGTIGFFFRFWLLSILLGEDLWIYTIEQITGILDWIFLRLGILATPEFTLVQILALLMVCFNNLIYLFVVHLVALLVFDRLGNPIPRPPHWVSVLVDYE
jgi:uncharacterized protein YybS (DUF2232 family)